MKPTYERCPHSARAVYTNHQRFIVFTYYADNETEDVAEAAGMTLKQTRNLAGRLGLIKNNGRPKPKRKRDPVITERKLERDRKFAYKKAKLNINYYQYPDHAVMNFTMVTGEVFSKPIGRMAEWSVKCMREAIFNMYRNAIDTYITIASKANT